MDIILKNRENKQLILLIIKKWEVLRIPYNIVLLFIIVIGVSSLWSKITNHQIFLIENIVSIIQANLLYFLGPLIEIGFILFDRDLSKYTQWLWILRTLLSVLLAVYSVSLLHERYG